MDGDYCLHCSSLLNISISFWLIANVKVISTSIHTAFKIVGVSYHIWLSYWLPQYYEEEDVKLLNEYEENELSQIGIKIEANDLGTEVKKCGF